MPEELRSTCDPVYVKKIGRFEHGSVLWKLKKMPDAPTSSWTLWCKNGTTYSVEGDWMRGPATGLIFQCLNKPRRGKSCSMIP
jgi:hypothetical protein